MLGIFFANGFEEIEALAVVDLLRRANIPVKMISINKEKNVTGAHGIEIIADDTISDIDFNGLMGIILPGGNPGFKNLEECEALMNKVSDFALDDNKLVAAICGAPSLLGHRGILNGKRATVYPGMEAHLTGADVLYDKVVADGNIITSRGAGTAIDFGLKIVEYYKGEAASKALSEAIVYV